MFKKFTTTDKLLFIAAFLSLIYSETLWFKGEKESAIFIGLWVPSIIGFAIYLKLLNNKKNDWLYTIFCRAHYFVVRGRFLPLLTGSQKKKIKFCFIHPCCFPVIKNKIDSVLVVFYKMTSVLLWKKLVLISIQFAQFKKFCLNASLITHSEDRTLILYIWYNIFNWFLF